ncbi:MAG: phosphatidate cytidylyltransferase [Oscillospiraceae bacterium]|nr:phosphatidate cytidylyltransferase [Oscillospiraceae bacterium]MBQ7130402.1 phosphatidate cytidylyltransferase [Oscillospiraceae bacterium]
MKTRIIASAVLVPLLFILVLWAPKMFAAVIFAVLMSIGSYELLYRTHLVKHPRLVIYASIMAFAVVMWSHAGAVHAWLLIGLMIYTIVLFSEMMMDHVKVRIEMLAMCYVAGAIVPFLLSSLVRILIMTTGRYVILIPFVVAFLSDAGAYFVGLKYGRHKLAPVVSPNKTIEGALGGVASAMVGMLIYILIIDLAFPQFTVNYGLALLYGLLGSLCGVFGDLCFSIIKRQTGIKDYGNLIPGHGGVLDRFDSMMMVAPLMEALLLLAPVVM